MFRAAQYEPAFIGKIVADASGKRIPIRYHWQQAEILGLHLFGRIGVEPFIFPITGKRIPPQHAVQPAKGLRQQGKELLWKIIVAEGAALDKLLQAEHMAVMLKIRGVIGRGQNARNGERARGEVFQKGVFTQNVLRRIGRGEFLQKEKPALRAHLVAVGRSHR